MTKNQLVESLKESGVLRSKKIIEAFNKIDRADFAPKSFKDEIYADFPLSIGFGQTISQPTTVAFMLELLDLKAGEKILDIGSGSGWTTALLAKITGGKKNGAVYGVEIIPELVKLGQENLSKYPRLPAKIFLSGKQIGLPDKGPYDKILVSASADVLPDKLLDQLKTGGKLVIPIGNSIWKISKISNSEIQKTEFPGFVFVPLV